MPQKITPKYSNNTHAYLTFKHVCCDGSIPLSFAFSGGFINNNFILIIYARIVFDSFVCTSESNWTWHLFWQLVGKYALWIIFIMTRQINHHVLRIQQQQHTTFSEMFRHCFENSPSIPFASFNHNWFVWCWKKVNGAAQTYTSNCIESTFQLCADWMILIGFYKIEINHNKIIKYKWISIELCHPFGCCILKNSMVIAC